MSGCDKPILIEKIVRVFPGPYVLKCIIFAALFGVPLLLITRFLDSFNLPAALSIFGSPPLLQGVATFSVANFVLLFYATYSVRYMRLKIAQTLTELPQGTTEKAKLKKVFSPVCKVYPAIILAVLLFGATLASFPDILQHSSGPLSLAQVLVSFPFVYLAYGTFVWVYISSIKSIHELGDQSVVPILEFNEDPHFGLKPLGNLSFSLALVYFAGLGLVFFSFIIIPAPLAFAVGLLIFSGLVLFFLPLDVFHHIMTRKKRGEQAKLRNYFKQLASSTGYLSNGMGLGDSKSVRHIIALEIIKRQVAQTSGWPFDSKTLTWLSAIVLAVLGSILTRYVLIFLGE